MKSMRWIPLFLLILGLSLAIYFRLYTYLSFASLQKHHAFLAQWTHEHYLLSVCCFIAIYIISVAISIPGAVFLTLISGFLFGLFWGTIYVVFSATIGAMVLFLAINTAFGEWLTQRAGDRIKKMELGFKQHAFNYLLTLRLIPIFPFWLINIAAALLNVSTRTFLTATFIGIIPGSFIYVSIGSGLNHLFDTGQAPNLTIIFTPPILLPLIGLAILSLIPVFYKKNRARKKHD
jgi:uncharacterized membrane protein YdjX (TVP38/TMEM64 family)